MYASARVSTRPTATSSSDRDRGGKTMPAVSVLQQKAEENSSDQQQLKTSEIDEKREIAQFASISSSNDTNKRQPGKFVMELQKPEQGAKSKDILPFKPMQLKAPQEYPSVVPLVIQRVKYAELGDDKSVVSTGFDFSRFISTKQGTQFTGEKPINIKKELMKDLDYPNLRAWITEFKARPKDDSASSSSAGPIKSAFGMLEKPPESVSGTGEHITFKTNVMSGINGMFDLWFYKRLNILDVDVKFSFDDEAMAQNAGPTIQTMARAWSNKFAFRNTTDGSVVKILIKIIPIVKAPSAPKEHHYNYVDVSGSAANPNVLRSNRQFSTRSVEADAGHQMSAVHEFGHVLGLGEEYDYSSQSKEPGHHKSIMKPDDATELDKMVNSKENVVINSIMGKGDEIQKQHYSAILSEFCKLIEKPASEWTIVPKA